MLLFIKCTSCTVFNILIIIRYFHWTIDDFNYATFCSPFLLLRKLNKKKCHLCFCFSFTQFSLWHFYSNIFFFLWSLASFFCTQFMTLLVVHFVSCYWLCFSFPMKIFIKEFNVWCEAQKGTMYNIQQWRMVF